MIYYVFRRNDGYVGSILADNRVIADYRLHTYTSQGKTVSFEILLETHDWDEAREFIHIERARISKEKSNDASE